MARADQHIYILGICGDDVGHRKYKTNTVMVFDPSYPVIDEENFPKQDWSNFYGDVTEQMPPKMPEPLGKEVILRLYVDADYAGDGVNRRSRTGFFILLNEAPIFWLSKKQSRVENSESFQS